MGCKATSSKLDTRYKTCVDCLFIYLFIFTEFLALTRRSFIQMKNKPLRSVVTTCLFLLFQGTADSRSSLAFKAPLSEPEEKRVAIAVSESCSRLPREPYVTIISAVRYRALPFCNRTIRTAIGTRCFDQKPGGFPPLPSQEPPRPLLTAGPPTYRLPPPPRTTFPSEPCAAAASIPAAGPFPAPSMPRGAARCHWLDLNRARGRFALSRPLLPGQVRGGGAGVRGLCAGRGAAAAAGRGLCQGGCRPVLTAQPSRCGPAAGWCPLGDAGRSRVRAVGEQRGGCGAHGAGGGAVGSGARGL